MVTSKSVACLRSFEMKPRKLSVRAAFGHATFQSQFDKLPDSKSERSIHTQILSDSGIDPLIDLI